jgi:putative ABC transport system permease protein
MKNENKIQPPAWAKRFLYWYCKPELLEDLEGDLHEYFERHCKSKGPTRARLIYVVDVFKFFRSYVVRKPKFVDFIIQWVMLGSYIKISGRSILRNRLFSTINIVGLAISMSVGLLIISLISDLLSYDKFHANGDRIYRVVTENIWKDNNQTRQLASTSFNAGKKIQETFTGIENTVILRNGFSGDASTGEKIIPINGLWSTESFFDIFSFPLLEGNGKTALKEPYSIVLTEGTAKKLFGNDDALGKTITFNMSTQGGYGLNDTIEYTITGILKNIPKFSHIQFEALCSFSSLELQMKDEKRAMLLPNDFMDWGSIWSNYVYIQIPENGNIGSIEQSLQKLSAAENAKLDNRVINLSLQHLYDIALGKDLSNPIGPTMMVLVIYILSGLAFVVIFSACLNYTNLSIARSLRRSREVGIRKVIGALRSHVLGQFIIESVIISILALVFSFGLYFFLRPQFLGIAPEFLELVQLDLSPKVILYFFSFAVAVGLLAGILPALFFSKINAIQVLKGSSSLKPFRNLNMRKAMIVIQYCFSLMFITATIIGYKQYKYFLAFDLGFNTSNVLNIELQGNKADVLRNELLEIPEIEMISKSAMVTSIGSSYGGQIKYTDPQDSSGVWYNMIDENYIPLHGHKLLSGRNFTAHDSKAEESEVIVNEQVLKRFNIANKDPRKAIGEVLTVDGKKLQIIAVMKDFHYGKVDNNIEPVVFRYSTEWNHFINAKIASTDWLATLASIEKKWKKIDKIHPLKATFYDDQIEHAYSQFSAMTKVIGFLAFLAISISSMGMLGMVVFATETRLKEVSIRKVLGATEGNLIFILSKGFLILLLISAVVALPLTYILFDQVVLSSIVYHAPIGFFDLVISVIVVVFIALVMIGSQTLKVARANPAEALKTE